MKRGVTSAVDEKDLPDIKANLDSRFKPDRTGVARENLLIGGTPVTFGANGEDVLERITSHLVDQGASPDAARFIAMKLGTQGFQGMEQRGVHQVFTKARTELSDRPGRAVLVGPMRPSEAGYEPNVTRIDVRGNTDGSDEIVIGRETRWNAGEVISPYEVKTQSGQPGPQENASYGAVKCQTEVTVRLPTQSHGNVDVQYNYEADLTPIGDNNALFREPERTRSLVAKFFDAIGEALSGLFGHGNRNPTLGSRPDEGIHVESANFGLHAKTNLPSTSLIRKGLDDTAARWMARRTGIEVPPEKASSMDGVSSVQLNQAPRSKHPVADAPESAVNVDSMPETVILDKAADELSCGTVTSPRLDTNAIETNQPEKWENNKEALLDLMSSRRSRDILWFDDYSSKMTSRDGAAIRLAKDQAAKNLVASGGDGLTAYCETDPVCGLYANNIFKLMAETNNAIDPTSYEKHKSDEFEDYISNLDPKKDHVFLINDNRLGHAYIVDIPEHAGKEKKVYIMQTNLGEGVLPPVMARRWLQSRSVEGIDVGELKALMSGEVFDMPEIDQKKLLAKIFLQNPNEYSRDFRAISLEKIKRDAPCYFLHGEYSQTNFAGNLASLDAQ